MIGGAKSMIAACIERMRSDGCGGCEKRDACAELMRRFGWSPGAQRKERTVAPNPLLSILGEIAGRIERSMAARPPSPFRGQVEKEIEALLSEGARMEAIARALGCGRQTLYRRLRDEGLTYEALVESVRRRLATRLLRDPEVSVKVVAYRLGFAEPAAFSRAFKRWTGQSPAAWRARRPGSGSPPPPAPARPRAG
jgi:AraC-like DNA-binding protein